MPIERNLTLHFLALCLAALLAIGPYIEAFARNGEQHPKPSRLPAVPASETVVTPSSIDWPSSIRTSIAPQTQPQPQSRHLSQHQLQPQPLKLPPSVNVPVQEKPTLTYITTAYYLNVRAQPNSKSEIFRSVERGTRLTVAGKTDNGWLELSDGGYVHGGYAVQAENDFVVHERPLETLETKPSKPTKPASAVRSDSGLTEDQIGTLLAGTELADNDLEAVIRDIEEEYGINAYFTIAVMKLESGNGSSRLARTKNNLFGLNATGGKGNKKAFQFETKADSVRKFGQLISDHYIGRGYTTVEKIAKKYCPANDKWPRLVKNIMVSDHKKFV